MARWSEAHGPARAAAGVSVRDHPGALAGEALGAVGAVQGLAAAFLAPRAATAATGAVGAALGLVARAFVGLVSRSRRARDEGDVRHRQHDAPGGQPAAGAVLRVGEATHRHHVLEDAAIVAFVLVDRHFILLKDGPPRGGPGMVRGWGRA